MKLQDVLIETDPYADHEIPEETTNQGKYKKASNQLNAEKYIQKHLLKILQKWTHAHPDILTHGSMEKATNKYGGKWVRVYTKSRGKFSPYCFVGKIDTPKDNIIYAAIKKGAQLEQIDKKVKKLKTEVNKLRIVSFDEQKSKTAAVNPESIPETIYTGKNKFSNPYYKANGGKFAGSPAHYPNWHTLQISQLNTINAALKRNQLQELTVMYGGTRNRYFNFAAIGANGKFVWRKYQTTSANGQNMIYIDGNSSYISFFMNSSISRQDELLKPLKTND